MKRILKALSAFSLSLLFVLSMASVPASAAENALSGDSDTPYAGYIVILTDPQPLPATLDPLAAATLLSAEAEREELLPLAEDWNIYKVGSPEEVQSLAHAGQIAVLEPDYQAELLDIDPTNPDDALLPQQENLVGDYGVNVRAPWGAGLTGEGVTIAVIDSGLNYLHEDAPQRIGTGRFYLYKENANGRYELLINGERKRCDFLSGDDFSDDLGHGSMVTGIIAAATDNGKGMASIAPGATIIPIRCFTGTAPYIGGLVSCLVSGINFAVTSGADVINMSWGVTEKSSSLIAAIDAAERAGCILVAAAGNDGAQSKTRWPAVLDNVISVGATDELGRLSYYSQRSTAVNVCAPGGSSRSKVISLNYDTTNGYNKGMGTSYSTPMVAAAAALLLEADPAMTQGDFLSLLNATSHPVTQDDKGTFLSEEQQEYTGAGLMDLQRLLDATGYAGSVAKITDSGFQVYAAYHPKGDDAPGGAIAIVGGYNAAGHLVESHSALLTKNSYNNLARAFSFQNPTIAEFRSFYLDPTSLSALIRPSLALPHH